MPTCRMCKQNYPNDQFISGNGPRYLVCARCGIDHGLANPDTIPQLYTDEIMNARFALYSARYLPWFVVIVGWLLFLSLGRGIELWSSLFLAFLLVATIAVPILHFLTALRFKAELSKLTP